MDSFFSHGYKFPVMVLPKDEESLKRKDLPLITLRACVSVGHQGLLHFKYFGLLLQELSVQIDEAFLDKLTLMMSRLNESDSWDTGVPLDDRIGTLVKTHHQTDSVVENLVKSTGTLMYFETLELAPIFFEISFSKSPLAATDSRSFMNTIGVIFKNVQDAPIHLEGKLLTGAFVTPGTLVSQLSTHYHESIMNGILSVVGSVQALGNPLGLFKNISSGLSDFITEPAEGLVQGNLLGFGQGLAKGSKSLIKKSVYGLGSAVAGFADNVGTGLATLTTDKEYMERRARARSRDRPDDVVEGIFYGTRSLAGTYAILILHSYLLS